MRSCVNFETHACMAKWTAAYAMSPEICVTAAATSAAGAISSGDEIAQPGANFWQGVFSVLNILMGVGLLSIPVALSKSGWAGLGVLWLLGFVTNYTGKALCRCSNTISEQTPAKRGEVTYEDIAGEAFGPRGRKLVSTIMYTELIGICSLLLILEGDNLWNQFSTAIANSPETCILYAALLVIPTVWAPNIKSLSVLGMAGFTATTTVCAVVAYTLLTGDFAGGASTAVVQWNSLPLIFGMMAFVYAGHSVFPAIQSSLQEPKTFPKVLDTAYLIVAVLCTFLGCAGYYMYGSAARDVITFNLKAGMAKTVCALLILVNPIAKFALTMEPVAMSLRQTLTEKLNNRETYPFRVLANTALACGILLIARFLPYLSLVMSLIGSFMTIGISVVFPAAANYKLHGKEMSKVEKAWCLVVVLVGIACAISGTTAAILGLKEAL